MTNVCKNSAANDVSKLLACKGKQLCPEMYKPTLQPTRCHQRLCLLSDLTSAIINSRCSTYYEVWYVNIISVKSPLLYMPVVRHSVHHTMGDVTFTDCTVGGFAGPGGNIGTASVSSQLKPGTEGVCTK